MPGYADYQRTVNYDDPLLLNDLGGAEVEKTQTKGRFDVSRFAYVMGKAQFTKVPVGLRLEWFTAETGGEPIGERFFRMDNQTPVSADLHIPNQGPWLQVRYEPESEAVKYKPAVRFMPSNRVLPFETIPKLPYIIAPQAVKIGAKASHIFRPEVYYGGPVELSGFNTITEGFVRFLGMFNSFEYTQFIVLSYPALALPRKLVMPFTAWTVEYENAGAEELQAKPCIVPSITGST